MVNKNKIAASFTRALPTYDRQAAVQRMAIGRLSNMIIRNTVKPVESILEIGCGTALFTKELHRIFRSAELVANDICRIDEAKLPEGVRFLYGDAERIPIEGCYDLIASSSTIQWFEDIEAFLRKAEKCLAPQGMVALSTFGPDNLTEIGTLTRRGLSYRSLEEWKGIISHVYDIVETEEARIPLFFCSPADVLVHLRETGVTALEAQPLSAGEVRKLCKTYEQRYRTEKGVPLTYHVIYIIAYKKKQGK